MGMTFDDYQRVAHGTSFNTLVGHPIVYPTLGLLNEAGEFAGKVKKFFRDDNGVLTPEREKQLQLELGDGLWYFSEICTAMGWNMDKIAAMNIEKVLQRQVENKTRGEGDVR